VLTEPLACVVSPLLDHPIPDGARALVIGAGSMGLLALAALKSLARVEVTMLCRHAYQAAHAERLGAARIVMTRGHDYVAELSRVTGGRLFKPILGPRIHVGGFDATMVCVSSDTAVHDALRFTRSGGSILLLGNVARLPRVDWTPLWIKELSVHGSLCYRGHGAHAGAGRSAFETAAALLAGPSGAALEPLVTHVVPLEDAREAVLTAIGRAGRQAIKVVIQAPDRT